MTPSTGGEAETKRGSQATSIVSVRLTPAERYALSAKADQCNLALSAFIRACALNTLDLENLSKRTAPKSKRLSSTERQQIALILASMARLMESIRAFSDDPVETQDQPHMLAVLQREITATRDQCFKALRRAP